MVLGGGRSKLKNPLTSQGKAAVKMALPPSSYTASVRSHRHKMTQPDRHKMTQPDSPADSESELFTSQDTSQNLQIAPAILKQFEHMLHKALKQTSEQITTNLTREIRELGNRTAALELKMDDLENATQEHNTAMENLREENLMLQTKLEDQENRARRSNLRIRGIPESIIDLQSTITALCHELQPDIPIERLEFDRIHRALTAKKLDGPPRDIIVKFHYYRTKEQLLSSARDKKDLNFQGNNYQLFADLSQVTISKRRAMKPLLMELQRQSIIYQWGFPFSVRFAYNGTKYICRSNEELQQTLIDLHLMDSSPRITSTRRRSPSLSSAGNSSQSTLRNGNHPSHKRGRFASPPQERDDSMD